MRHNLNKAKLIMLAFFSVLLASLTLVLGAPPLRVLRISYGGTFYWVGALAIATGLWMIHAQAFSVTFIGLVLVVGIFTELERWTKKWIWPGLVAVFFSSIVVMGLTKLWTWQKGWDLKSKLKEQIELFLSQTGYKAEANGLDIEALLSQAPSAIVSVLMISLALSLIYEKRLLETLKLKKLNNKSSKIDLLSFQVPDIFIWVMMLSFLVTFLNFNQQWLSLLGANFLNFLIVLYFFQGLAIIEQFFEMIKLAPMWRLLIYLIAVLQLFFVVSAIGILDFWADFRSRIAKRRFDNKI